MSATSDNPVLVPILGDQLTRSLAMLRGRYRYRFLVNARRSVELQKIILRWLDSQLFAPGVRVGVDIDPYSFV
jgi:primosomal protein N' (replication factor Y)